MQKQKLNTVSAKKKWETRNKINNNEKKKRFKRDVVACRAKFRMLTLYCHYFHN